MVGSSALTMASRSWSQVTGTTLSLVVVVSIGAPVEPVTVVVPVVCCPHAGNTNTKRKVSAANIVRKYGTGFPLLLIYPTNPTTIVYRCKQCNDLAKRCMLAFLKSGADFSRGVQVRGLA